MERKSKTNHLGEKGNIKTFVLDTNVLIHDRKASLPLKTTMLLFQLL